MFNRFPTVDFNVQFVLLYLRNILKSPTVVNQYKKLIGRYDACLMNVAALLLLPSVAYNITQSHGGIWTTPLIYTVLSIPNATPRDSLRVTF